LRRRLEREQQEAELAAEAARKLKAAEDEAAAGQKQVRFNFVSF
jgi:hypothetical protein